MRISDWSSDVCSSDLLKSRFKASVLALKSAIAAYVHDGTLPPADAASTGLFDYPALRLVTDGVRREGQGHNLAFGRFEHAGAFVTTVTRPDLFEEIGRASCRERVCQGRSRWLQFH